ncbi:tetratricopeptide repeat protein [Sagittula sp. SSi028]|uniref:tetratricopeptide repeat protein n=1 Tax=Sagittula sp. SSi028 TaxID=3400636 RepID=UPI003AF96931
MSDTDSFIDEVTEEVKRDRLYAQMRKYGWIAVVAVVVLVGGTAWSEYRKAQDRAAAEALGDQVLAALSEPDSTAQAEALDAVSAETPGARALAQMLAAEALAEAGDTDAAVNRLQAIAEDDGVEGIYRQIAQYKALTLGASVLSAEDRRAGFESLSVAGQPLRLLAEEQLALIEIEAGDTDAALMRLTAIVADAEVSTGLRRRATQLIVALGGDLPEQA